MAMGVRVMVAALRAKRGRGLGRGRGRGRGRAAARGARGGRGPGGGSLNARVRPHKDTTMPFTAHHMLVWTLHSIELLRPFLPENAMQFAFWRAWVYQVEIISSLMAPEFTHAGLLTLESTLNSWFTTVFSVPEYKDFWVPKYHFAMHLAHDIWRFGPPRLNWCFGYEAKNQPLKRGCKRSNFKNPAKATAEFWCQSSDHHLQSGRARRLPANQPGEVVKLGAAAIFPHMSAELAHVAAELGLDAEAIYSFLGSVACQKQQLYPQGYADITVAGVAQLAKIEHLIVADNHMYAFVTLYAPSVRAYDVHGVLHIAGTALADTSTSRYMCLSMSTHAIAPLWHFPQSDGSITFISKW